MTFYFLQYGCPCKCAAILKASSLAHGLQFVLFYYAFAITVVILLIKKKRKTLDVLGETGETRFTQCLPLNAVVTLDKMEHLFEGSEKQTVVRGLGN